MYVYVYSLSLSHMVLARLIYAFAVSRWYIWDQGCSVALLTCLIPGLGWLE